MAAISSGVTTGITAAIFLRCPTVEGPTTLLTLPDGRTLAADDVGAPDGRPVVYVHGTPDSRLARHPDDGLARRLGVRLVAVDRPGFGHSSPHPEGTVASLRRGRGAAGRPPRPRPVRGARPGRPARCPRSASAPACAARVHTVGIAAGLVPSDRPTPTPAVLAAAHFGQRLLVEMADGAGRRGDRGRARPLPRARPADPRARPRAAPRRRRPGAPGRARIRARRARRDGRRR